MAEILAKADGKITKTVVCSVTGKEYSVTVPLEQYRNWKAGMLIQQAMPGLSADEREIFVSGTTPAEWDVMFPDVDEDEDK